MTKLNCYFDYAATTPLARAVKRKLQTVERQLVVGKPSAQHTGGRRQRAFLEASRSRLARWLGVGANELVFTASATEANNLAIQGAILTNQSTRPHVIVSAVEH